MGICALQTDGIELEHPVLYRTMSAFTDVAKLNASAHHAFLVIANGSSRKAHGIPGPFLGQASTTLGVAKIAEIPQLFG